MQHNHKALGKSRACSGSPEDHLTCCAFGTVLCRESALARLGEDKNAAGAWGGAKTLATKRRAAAHQDGHSRDRGQRRGDHAPLDAPGCHQHCPPPTAELPSTVAENGVTTSAIQTCGSCHSHFGSAYMKVGTTPDTWIH